MTKALIISDVNKKSQRIKSIVQKKIKNNPPKKNNIVIVVGGDGFMLKTLKKNIAKSKLFYGINSGNYGFLMNKFSEKNLIKNLNHSKLITISPLEMKVKTKDNRIKKSIAINEVSILRQSRQAASLCVRSGKKILIKNLMSDGILVSTPAGSTCLLYTSDAADEP